MDTYTNQLRALEAHVREKPDSAPGQFLLAYLYMVQGDKPAAAARFATVARLQPQDRLAGQLAKSPAPEGERQKVQQPMRPEAPSPPPSPAGHPAAAESRTQAPPPLPANLVGTW